MFFAICDMFELIDIKFVEQKFNGVGIQNLKSKLLIIFFKLYNTRLITLKLVYIFFGFIIT